LIEAYRVITGFQIKTARNNIILYFEAKPSISRVSCIGELIKLKDEKWNIHIASNTMQGNYNWLLIEM